MKSILFKYPLENVLVFPLFFLLWPLHITELCIISGKSNVTCFTVSHCPCLINNHRLMTIAELVAKPWCKHRINAHDTKIKWRQFVTLKTMFKNKFKKQTVLRYTGLYHILKRSAQLKGVCRGFSSINFLIYLWFVVQPRVVSKNWSRREK